MKAPRLSTTHIIMLSFLAAILVGSFLLALPVSSADGKGVPYIDALFTATTATCVTGLVTVTTASAWSVFGQVVILLLIQIGGLGIITVMSGLMILINHRMGIGDRLLIQDAFNLNTMSGLGEFIKKVLLGTLIIEGAGALLYMPVFVSDFGVRGIWISVFNSVSAFCNAGMDIIGENSLYDYATNPLVNLTTIALIILGGIGYIVWWDVIRVFGTEGKHRLRRLTLHSKIALSVSLLLVLVGGVCIFAFEYNNPATIGSLSLFDKIQVSLFQSVTTRTAGFASIPQQDLTDPSAIISILLMFIGGSPVGTAGGIKTVTLAVLIASAMASVTGKNDVTLFNRTVSKQAVSKASAVCTTSFTILFISTLLLAAVTDAPFMDVLYETASATATVGLTRGITPTLSVIGKTIIIINMYLGRVGPISLALALNGNKKTTNAVKNPTEDISVG
ncbi:MAG: potassium transporter KtrB [Clostridia bacterium]|nr:potassium transporter KtrB [Clostridia bacterium]